MSASFGKFDFNPISVSSLAVHVDGSGVEHVFTICTHNRLSDITCKPSRISGACFFFGSGRVNPPPSRLRATDWHTIGFFVLLPSNLLILEHSWIVCHSFSDPVSSQTWDASQGWIAAGMVGVHGAVTFLSNSISLRSMRCFPPPVGHRSLFYENHCRFCQV